ncbi:MAG: flagellar hook-basal body complex protein FliE [Limnohabitans sp.]|jgi:flagellar hook-basal body complex protein FliE
MIDKVNSQANIQSMLATLRSHSAQAAGMDEKSANGVGGAAGTDFGQSIQKVLEQVNDLQAQSKGMVERYQRGENVPLTEVVLATQKSSLAFEATLQVRNKVLKAYEDILNMPV